MRTALRLLAPIAALTWAALCLQVLRGPGTYTAEQSRTLAFVLAFYAAPLGWTPKPPKRGGRNKERL